MEKMITFKKCILAAFCMTVLLVYGMNVWAAEPDLSKAQVTFPTAVNGKLETVVYNEFAYGTWHIPSELAIVTVDGQRVSPGDYLITLKGNETGGTLKNPKLAGLLYTSDPFREDSPTDFFTKNPPESGNWPEIAQVEYCPLDSSYWTISVDDSNCNFVQSSNPTPQVSITSLDWSVELEEGVDFRLEKENQGNNLCGRKSIKIFALPGSQYLKPPTGNNNYITRTYIDKYSDLEDYYTLEGMPDEIPYEDLVPQFYDWEINEVYSKYPTEQELLEFLSGQSGYNLYLKEKDNYKELGGALPILDSSDNMALWSGANHLKIQYKYNDTGWKDSFNWQDWLDSHTTNTIMVKVSVNTKGEDYYIGASGTGSIVPRYLTGSIISSFQVAPYSLSETNTGGTHPTLERENGVWDFVFVNPVEGEKHSNPGLGYKKTEGTIESVTYNGKAREPAFTMGLYCSYEGRPEGYPMIIKEGFDREDPLVKSIVYKDNVDAGKASVTVDFQNASEGFYTGSITREFEILAKAISDSTVEVTAKDAVYTGSSIVPELTVIDTDRGEVLVEGQDYSVLKVSASENTAIGTGKVSITGQGNYQGTKEVEFKIIPKSLNDSSIEITIPVVNYTGKPILPEIKIIDTGTGKILEVGKDYKVETAPGADNIEAGYGKALITGLGTYEGTIEAAFTIVKKEEPDTEKPKEPEKPGGIQKEETIIAISRKDKSLKLLWKQYPGYRGNQVYMSNKKDGTYKKVITSRTDRKTIKNLKPATTYYFKTRGYKKIGSKVVYTPFTEPVAISTTTVQPSISVKSNERKTAIIKWKRDKKAQGYQIWIKNSSDGKYEIYKRIDKVPKRSWLTVKAKGLKRGSRQVFKVRSYRMVFGKRIYSKFSRSIAVRVK